MKKASRLVAILLIFALLVPSISVYVSASDTESGNDTFDVKMEVYIPAEQLDEFESGISYDTKTTYFAEDGIASRTDYSYEIPAFQTSTYQFGYIDYGTTMYMNYVSNQVLTASLYYGNTSSSCNDVAFSYSTRVLAETYAGRGYYYKLSMYNYNTNSATISLTVYTY